MPVGAALGDAELAALAVRPDASLPQLAPVGGSTVRLLTDVAEALPEMLSAVQGAKHKVDFSMFSLSDSGAGKQMIDLLVDRSRAGVQVRVTVDQVGSAVLPVGAGRSMLDRLEDAGAEVAVNDRIEGTKLIPVDHRKLLVVDDQVAFTGGMNLSKKFGTWHDVMARIDGPGAAQLGAHFVDRWVDMAGVPEGVVATQLAKTAPGGGRGVAGAEQAGRGVALLVNHPGRELHASNHLLENLEQASSRAWILTPTLSDPAVVQALAAAARRGVDARVAVSGPEGWIGTRALRVVGQTFYKELIDAGVKVYEQPGMSHAKVSLVDHVASVGSLNMTRRAMLWDHELMVATDDTSFVKQINDLFETDFGASTLFGPEHAERMSAKVGDLLRRAAGLKW